MIYRPTYAAHGFWGRSDIPPKMRQHERGFAGGGKQKRNNANTPDSSRPSGRGAAVAA